jgi:hypothetical protein
MLRRRDPSLSQLQGLLLMVAITVILAALLLAYLMGLFWFESGCECNPPSPIKITMIDNARTSAGRYKSVVTIQNTAPYPFPNDDLRLDLLINGEKFREVSTLNGHNFISSHHYGVQTIGGLGTQNQNMIPRSLITINFADNTIYPNELVTVRIYQKGKGNEFFLDSKAILDEKCRNDWAMAYFHSIHNRAPCPISEDSMRSS